MISICINVFIIINNPIEQTTFFYIFFFKFILQMFYSIQKFLTDLFLNIQVYSMKSKKKNIFLDKTIYCIVIWLILSVFNIYFKQFIARTNRKIHFT